MAHLLDQSNDNLSSTTKETPSSIANKYKETLYNLNQAEKLGVTSPKDREAFTKTMNPEEAKNLSYSLMKAGESLELSATTQFNTYIDAAKKFNRQINEIHEPQTIKWDQFRDRYLSPMLSEIQAVPLSERVSHIASLGRSINSNGFGETADRSVGLERKSQTEKGFDVSNVNQSEIVNKNVAFLEKTGLMKPGEIYNLNADYNPASVERITGDLATAGVLLTRRMHEIYKSSYEKMDIGVPETEFNKVFTEPMLQKIRETPIIEERYKVADRFLAYIKNTDGLAPLKISQTPAEVANITAAFLRQGDRNGSLKTQTK